MIKNLLLTLLLSLAHIVAWSQSYLPTSRGEIVARKYYTLSYDEEWEQAEWVYYILTPEMVSGNATRRDNFRADNAVSTGSASLADYKGSGYDRGHLCPAASMSINDEAMSESFFLSNMSPQLPAFNRGVWKRLEEAVRDFARRDSVIHVITAPLLTERVGTIGENQVVVPKYYYKVIYSPKKGAMIAFLLENEKSQLPLEQFAVSVDRIEELSGIDMFSERELQHEESTCDPALWFTSLE